MATYRVEIPGWHPARLNQLLDRCWQRAYRRKKADLKVVAAYVRVVQRVPKAAGKRRVSLTIRLGPRQRAGDPDAYWKSLLDALVGCGLLVDDSRQWVELAPVSFERGERAATVLVIEDLGEGGS